MTRLWGQLDAPHRRVKVSLTSTSFSNGDTKYAWLLQSWSSWLHLNEYPSGSGQWNSFWVPSKAKTTHESYGMYNENSSKKEKERTPKRLWWTQNLARATIVLESAVAQTNLTFEKPILYLPERGNLVWLERRCCSSAHSLEKVKRAAKKDGTEVPLVADDCWRCTFDSTILVTSNELSALAMRFKEDAKRMKVSMVPCNLAHSTLLITFELWT